MEHTNLPWSVESDGISLTMCDQCVATAIAPDGASMDEQRANAAFIVRACNAYADLVAALEEIVARADEPCSGIARAALAKAKQL